MIKRKIDIANWHRKDHFNFFRVFEEPFFGITVKVDAGKAYDLCKSNNHSFFLYYLYQSLRAVNQTEAFTYRIAGEEVIAFERIDASPTINRPNGGFGFSYMQFAPSFREFEEMASKEIERVRSTTGLEPAMAGENVVHYSALPWIDFSSLSHARSYSFLDSCPKISFGKLVKEGNKVSMSMSVHAHHALVDGKDVADYIDRFQEFLNNP